MAEGRVPPLTVYLGDALGRYGFGESHPFGPGRLHAFWDEARRRGLDQRVRVAESVACGAPELTRFHTRRYVEEVCRRSHGGTGFLDQGDTPAFPGMFEAGCHVVGSGLDGLAGILSGEGTRRVFVPIGGLHHGRRDGAAGFCVFNDIGVLIETLRRCHGVRRVAYVDIDAHHGDGVFYAFEDDPDLCFADIHEDGQYLYPGTGSAGETGSGPAEGTKLNIPLPPGADDRAFHVAWARVEAFVRAARPEIVLLQAGADSVAGDPITHLAYTPAAHAHAADRLARIADELCDGRLIAFGGGGYNLHNLAAAWSAVVESLCD